MEGRNLRDGEGNWKIGSWDKKKMLNRGANTGKKQKVSSETGEVLSGEKRVSWKTAGMMARKEEGPESEGVTCIVDGCDNGGVERDKKS